MMYAKTDFLDMAHVFVAIYSISSFYIADNSVSCDN